MTRFTRGCGLHGYCDAAGTFGAIDERTWCRHPGLQAARRIFEPFMYQIPGDDNSKMLALQHPQDHGVLHNWVLNKELTLVVKDYWFHSLQPITFLDDIADRGLCQALGEIKIFCLPGRQSLLDHAAINILVFANLQVLSTYKSSLIHLCEWEQRSALTIYTLILTKIVTSTKDQGTTCLLPWGKTWPRITNKRWCPVLLGSELLRYFVASFGGIWLGV